MRRGVGAARRLIGRLSVVLVGFGGGLVGMYRAPIVLGRCVARIGAVLLGFRDVCLIAR